MNTWDGFRKRRRDMAAGNAKANGETAGDLEMVFHRVFDAPRKLVFDMWTNAAHVPQWWGPNGFTTTIHEMDVRPGGVWRLTMHGPDGTDYKCKIVYVEVTRPERLVYKHETEPPTHPADFETTVTFTERGEKTEVTMRTVFPTAEMKKHVKEHGADQGTIQMFGRLVEHLGAMRAMDVKVSDLLLTREFDAPRRAVFEAWSNPVNLKQWFGPRGCTMWKFEMEFRVGGKLEFGYRGPDGTEYPPFAGTYVNIEEPKKIVFAGKLHGPEEQNVRTVVTFEEMEGKTKLTVHQTYERESFATRGAPEGWRQTLDQLKEFLAQ
jgi:uncharacterized protein YndB with AHSA1/START domain